VLAPPGVSAILVTKTKTKVIVCYNKKRIKTKMKDSGKNENAIKKVTCRQRIENYKDCMAKVILLVKQNNKKR